MAQKKEFVTKFLLARQKTVNDQSKADKVKNTCNDFKFFGVIFSSSDCGPSSYAQSYLSVDCTTYYKY